ncbi:hypothetical protein DFH07DRAFT_707848, partial [Mycena maculata]
KVKAAKKKTEKKAAKKKKKADDSSEDSADDEADEADSKGEKALDVESVFIHASNARSPLCSWKDPELSLKLIACIYANKAIKQALYPPCGANASSADGGGKTKVTAQWELAVLLLSDIDKFKQSLAACLTSKQRLAYANKMKNRLRAMEKITRTYDTEMGQTGAGIERASDIDM